MPPEDDKITENKVKPANEKASVGNRGDGASKTVQRPQPQKPSTSPPQKRK